jgi:hypothetical protein
MAKIWPVYEGKEPTIGGAWAKMPASEAITLFNLEVRDFLSELENTPRFGDQNQEMTDRGYKHVVIEIEKNDRGDRNLKPGFYKAKDRPREALRKIFEYEFKKSLGEDNVVKVDYSEGVDSFGKNAIKFKVVLSPQAVDRFDDDAVINILSSLRENLFLLRNEHTPIITYVTEEELQENGGH